MTILSSLLGLEHRATLRNPPDWLVDSLTGGSATLSGERVSPASATGLSAYYAALRAISEDCGKLPLMLYKRRSKQGKDRLPKHPIYRLIHDEPNPTMSSQAFRETLTHHAMGWGNGYAQIQRRGAVPIALWPITPDRVSAEWVDDKRKREIVYIVRGQAGEPNMNIPMRDMFHLHGLGFDGLGGYSIAKLAKQSLGLAMAQEKSGAAFFGNAARPHVVLETTDVLDPEAKKKLVVAWERAYKGVENAHRTAILEDGLKASTLSIPNKDAEWIASMQHSVEEVARWFRIPPHKLQHLLRATFCLPASTMVFTTAGPRRIDEIKANDEVWSYDGAGFVHANVTRSQQTGTDDILRIESRGAVLRCNARHRVLVRREELEPFARGRGRCVTQKTGRWRRAWKELYIQADELMVGDELVAPLTLPDQGKTTLPNGRKATVPFCETVGHHLGDGFTASTRGYPSVVGFSHAENEETQPHYANALAVSCAPRTDIYMRSRIVNRPTTAKRRDRTATVIYNGAAANEMCELGVTGTAHHKRVPGWVFGLRRDFRMAVLRGYLDSDGSVDKLGRASFVSVARELVDGFRHLAISCGLRTGRITSRMAPPTTIKDRSVSATRSYRFSITKAADVLSIGSHRSDYRERAEAAVKAHCDRLVTIYPHERRRRGLDGNVRYLRIVNIGREPSEPVYDLTVEGTHSFIADGVVVHNSNISHQSIEYVVDTLLSWLKRWEAEIWRKLIPEADQAVIFAEHVVEGLLRGDSVARFDGYQKAIQTGWMNRNEARSLENMNPEEGLDEFLEPMNMETVGAAGSNGNDGAGSKDGTDGQPGKDGIDGKDGRDGQPGPIGLPGEPAARLIDLNAVDALIESHAPLLAEAYGRVLRVEADRAERADKRCQLETWAAKFYPEHAEAVRGSLVGPVEAFCTSLWTICTGKAPKDLLLWGVATWTVSMVERHVEWSRADIEESDTSATLKLWRSERAAQVAPQELRILADAILELRAEVA